MCIRDRGAGPVLPTEIEDTLAHYAWPGNYRQLAAVLRTCLLYTSRCV